MKKLILVFVMFFMFSSICIAEEDQITKSHKFPQIEIQKGDLNITLDSGFLAFIAFILFMTASIIIVGISEILEKKYKYSNLPIEKSQDLIEVK